MIAQVQPYITFIGILLQLAGGLLLTGLFLVLRRYARRRRYFGVWGTAWLALSLAIAAMVVRFAVLSPLLPGSVTDGAAIPMQLLFFVYQLGKLSFLALLIAGTRSYVTGAAITPFLPVAVGLSAAYALVSVYLGRGLNGLFIMQAPLSALAYGWCGVRLLMLPSSRHAVGSRLTAAVFMAMAALAVLYFLAFSSITPAGAADPGPYVLLVRFNPYFDVLLHMVLGAGMVVLLMEDAKREVDDAHAELAVAHNELRRAALYDTVTGTLNRRAFAEGVGLELARAKYGAVLMLDVDDLKSVNDVYGHSAGDALLRHLSDVVRSRLRPSDKVYRWGGDEFLLVLPGADGSRAQSRVRSIIAAALPLRLGPTEQEVPLRVSTGVASYTKAEQMVDSINAADAAMYHEKTRKKIARGSGTPAA